MIPFALADIARILIVAGFVLLGIQLASLAIRGKAINVAGTPSIYPPLFYLAKIGLTVSFACMLWSAIADNAQLTTSRTVVCIILFLSGCAILALSFYRLGASLRMGIPDEQTSLVTSGIYRFSRNPIYLGLFVLLAASLLYTFSWVNVGAVIITVILHHRIALAEEKFLSARFKEYGDYRKGVPRYF
jgi:protein-S-isoprenylcysteine O-methyltransferase Ste14